MFEVADPITPTGENIQSTLLSEKDKKPIPFFEPLVQNRQRIEDTRRRE